MASLSESFRDLVPAIRSLPPIPISPVIEAAVGNKASAFYEKLTAWIQEFDASLDNTKEVGVRLVNFGQTVSFHLEGIGYANPSLISFTGTTESGDKVHLIQHVSQISILLMALPRANPDEPKQPYGFHGIQTERQSPATELESS